MEPAGESTHNLLAKAALATVAVFLTWLLLTRDVVAAAQYAVVIALVEVVLGFGFRAWRARKPVSRGDV